VLFNQVKKVTV